MYTCSRVPHDSWDRSRRSSCGWPEYRHLLCAGAVSASSETEAQSRRKMPTRETWLSCDKSRLSTCPVADDGPRRAPQEESLLCTDYWVVGSSVRRRNREGKPQKPGQGGIDPQPRKPPAPAPAPGDLLWTSLPDAFTVVGLGICCPKIRTASRPGQA